MTPMERALFTPILIAVLSGVVAGAGGTFIATRERGAADAVAAYAYAQCVAGSQGKQEGSAAYGCTDRGRQLDAAVGALIAREPVQ